MKKKKAMQAITAKRIQDIVGATGSRQVAVAYFFESSSSDKPYQTLLYSDNTTSCDCPGWTKRCVAGARTCKHTRLVDAGQAKLQCKTSTDYRKGAKFQPQQTQTIEPAAPLVPGKRRFDWD